MEQWRGLRWIDTVPSDMARQVARAVEGVRREGHSSCFTVNQRLPSGRELLLEYTTVKLGGKSGFIAIGKNVEAISELRSRLALVQQEREQDYWKLREIETRYRALLDASSERSRLCALRICVWLKRMWRRQSCLASFLAENSCLGWRSKIVGTLRRRSTRRG